MSRNGRGQNGIKSSEWIIKRGQNVVIERSELVQERSEWGVKRYQNRVIREKVIGDVEKRSE